MKKLSTLLWIMLLVTACSKGSLIPEPEQPGFVPESVPQLMHPAPVNQGFQVVAYFPYYRDMGASDIPDSKLKMLDVASFAFAQLNSDFTVTVPDREKLAGLSARCRRLGVKILIGFNGRHSDYRNMVAKEAHRRIFINSLKNLVETFSLDGIDNDWEYPSAKDGTGEGNLYLMRELSNYCHDPAVGKILTMSITCGKYEGNYTKGILDGVYDCVDWFNVMAYDDFSTTVPGIHHSPLSLVETAYAYWVQKRSMPPSKFVTGIPVYGRPSGIPQKGTVLTYRNIIGQGGNPDADQASVYAPAYRDGTVPYTVYYNGRPLVREKCRFSLERNLGGIMFWEAGQDTQDETSLILAACQQIDS